MPIAPYKVFGEGVVIEEGAIKQMVNACSLPISIAGAILPDSHEGYSLPIGGVLATRNCVSPSFVGVDIACRVSMTVFDYPVKKIQGELKKLVKILDENTIFGLGCKAPGKINHSVMDEDWSFSEIVQSLKDHAWEQLSTQGGGNHFANFGIITFENEEQSLEFGLRPGDYFALLTHGGSRGTGLKIANHFSKYAQQIRQNELPKHLLGGAWLDLDHEKGQEYWKAMELMGRYASANHEITHDRVRRALKAKVLAHVENHHNFAWKEMWNGEEVIVHRKGATPAHLGKLGIIAGTMATSSFLVKGKGNVDSINSASHGAGRAMSRKATKEGTTWHDAKKIIEAAGVTLISAGLDEVPFGYKNVEKVMAAQHELVEIIGRFTPKIVKMAEGKGDDGD